MADEIKEGVDFLKTLSDIKDTFDDDKPTETKTPTTYTTKVEKPRKKLFTATSGSVDVARVYGANIFSIEVWLRKQLSNILQGKLSSLLGG